MQKNILKATLVAGFNVYNALQSDDASVGYSGEDNMADAYFPTVFMIFDLEGNYIKTLDVGYKIQDFCIYKDNHRIIMALVDEIQFAYLDLQQLI